MNKTFSNLKKVVMIAAISLCSMGSTKGLKPGLLLTFDDRNMINWEKQIPLFAKYGAHVTFFIDDFDQLTPDQIGALQKLKNAGHAIGCHGLRHLKAVDYSAAYSVEKYIANEIEPAIKAMEEKGFPAASFAYPNSSSNENIDKALQKYFRHLRSGCRIGDEIAKTDNAFVKIDEMYGKIHLDGISFHPKAKTDDLVVQAKKAINRLKKNRELLVLYAHDIRNENEPGPKNFITVEALEEILAYAKKNHIQLYSFDELPS